MFMREKTRCIGGSEQRMMDAQLTAIAMSIRSVRLIDGNEKLHHVMLIKGLTLTHLVEKSSSFNEVANTLGREISIP